MPPRTTQAEQKQDGSIIADRELALAEDKETLVNAGDVSARHAFCAEGDTIAATDAKRLRLVVVEGHVKQSPAAAPKTTTTAPSPSTPAPARTRAANRE